MEMSSGENESSDNNNNEQCEMSCEKMDIPEAATVAKDKQKQKYNLRRSSVIKRIHVEEKQKAPKPKKEKPKHKSRPQPLSKYRRKSANLRERTRITDMNAAYEGLRMALPQMSNPGKQSKLPKQTILRLALNYIYALRGVLGYEQSLNSDGDSNSLWTGSCSSEEESNSCSSPCYLNGQSSQIPDVTIPPETCYDDSIEHG